MKKTSLIVGALLIAQTIFGQITNVTGTEKSASEGYARANSITTTSFTNDYTAVCGEFTGTFGVQVGPNTYPVASAGAEDIFVQVMFNDDFHNWGRTIGGPGEDRGVEVLKDDENVYIAGVFSGTVDFDPQQGTAIRNAVGGTDIFLLCLNRFGGNFNWVQTFGGPEDDEVTAMDWYYDENGFKSNLYLTGSFQGRADFQPGKLRLEKTSNGGEDCFVSSFLPNGWFQWVKTWGGELDDRPYDISVQRKNGSNSVELAVCGEFRADVDFDPGPGVFTLTTVSSALRAGFLMKMDDIGNFSWAGEFDSPQSLGGPNLWASTTTFDDDGNIYVAGVFDGSPTAPTDFDLGPGTYLLSSIGGVQNGFLASYNNNGGLLWVNQFTNNGSGCQPSDSDVAGEKIYLVGQYSYNSDFDPNVSGSGEVSSSTGDASFIVRHDLSGNFEWVKEAIALNGSEAKSVEAYVLGCQGRVSFCGYYKDDVSIDLDPEVSTFWISDNMGVDGARTGYTALWYDDVCEVKPQNSSSDFFIQPNPSADGSASISVPKEELIRNVEVINSNGTILNTEASIRGSFGQINLRNYEPGVYYVIVTTDFGSETLKWVIL
ncbi:MAG: hypothetical protein Crog4KO_17300 [Crocinitomicaceae bacterium]